MAETHGMLDTPAGPPDKTLYAMLVDKTAPFRCGRSAEPRPTRPLPGPATDAPLLPDPFASGAAFVTLPGATADRCFEVPFSGTWPDTRPFRLVLDEGSGQPAFTGTATERVLRVQLPKAEKLQWR